MFFRRKSHDNQSKIAYELPEYIQGAWEVVWPVIEEISGKLHEIAKEKKRARIVYD